MAAEPGDIRLAERDLRLDISDRSRVSLFPWRGQFSPQLVSALLSTYSERNFFVVDPFVGSGTTLFECARLNRRSYGSEIHPGALQFAKLSSFASMPADHRNSAITRAIDLFAHHWSVHASTGLFGTDSPRHTATDAIAQMLGGSHRDPPVDSLIRAAVLLGMRNGSLVDPVAIERSLYEVATKVRSLPHAEVQSEAQLADARALPLESETADLVITSPPYINVFNYHQNFRPAMELLGWKPLDIAKSEIGSNRKHRGNRFLTVIQYALDMAASMTEMSRVLRPGCRAILVVGRESRVRGVSFQNGSMLASIAQRLGSYSIEQWKERRFLNRFGATIVEDILVLRRADNESTGSWEVAARSVARDHLEMAQAPDSPVADALRLAVSEVDYIRPSALLVA